jgi:type VI secretion system protein ImpA
MNGQWEQLLQPISEDRPCGVSLEDTDELASFDAFRLFGHKTRPLDAPPDKNDQTDKWVPKPADSPEWIDIRDKAFETLGKSKDLRVLACLGTAVLRTDGVPAFSETLNVASQWLERHWNEVYPLIDEDAVLRTSALNCLADPMAVVEGLRRVRLVSSRQHGAFSLRDIDQGVDENQLSAAFASAPVAELARLHDSATLAVASLQSIDARMREAAGTDSAPGFDGLTTQLTRLGQLLGVQMARHPENAAAAEAGRDSSPAPGQTFSPDGAIRSREDAIRALDTVAEFFRRTEPSSPIPLFLSRAKRLVSKDFLEVLADIAPDAVAQARAAGGLKDQ